MMSAIHCQTNVCIQRFQFVRAFYYIDGSQKIPISVSVIAIFKFENLYLL